MGQPPREGPSIQPPEMVMGELPQKTRLVLLRLYELALERALEHEAKEEVAGGFIARATGDEFGGPG